MQHIDRGRITYRVDGAVGPVRIVLDQLEHAGAPNPCNALAIGGVSANCTAYKATPKVRRTSLGKACISLRLDAIQPSLLGSPSPKI